MKRAGGWLEALAASGLTTASVPAADPSHPALVAAAKQAPPKLPTCVSLRHRHDDRSLAQAMAR
jgi:hypothetical protein